LRQISFPAIRYNQEFKCKATVKSDQLTLIASEDSGANDEPLWEEIYIKE